MRLSSRACQPIRRHIWCSRRNAAAARCSSNRCGRPAWPANRGEFFQYLPTTSQSPQPRQWFEGVDDESILRLLDPLDEGKPDLAPPEIWRDYIRTVGRTPNGIWGGKLMWNQTPLLLQRAAGLPDRSGDGLLAAIRDVIGSDPVLIHVYRPDVVSQAVSFWRAVQTRVWRGRPDPGRDARAEYHAGAIAHVVTMLRAQEKGWRTWFDEESVEPMEVSYPVLWRNLTQVVGHCPRGAWGRIRGWRRHRSWNARPINAPTNG